MAWTGSASGEEYATTNPCGPDPNPCAGQACSGNLLADGQITWNIQARVYCDRSTGFPVSRAYIVHQDIAVQQRVYAGRCRCPDDTSSTVSYFGVVTDDEDALLRDLGITDSVGNVVSCPDYGMLGRVPRPAPHLVNDAPIGVNCAGEGWGPIEVIPSFTCGAENHQNTGTCGFYRDDSQTIVNTCFGGTASRTIDSGENPCLTLRPGGVRLGARHNSRLVVTPTVPCGSEPLGTRGFL